MRLPHPGLLMLRGSLALITAAIVLTLPNAVAEEASIGVFAAYAGLVGLLAMLAAFRSVERAVVAERAWAPLVLEGALGCVGALAVPLAVRAGLSPATLVGAWLVLTGLTQLYGAATLRAVFGLSRRTVRAWGWMGTISSLCGLSLLATPLPGPRFMLAVLSGFLLGFGLAQIAFGRRARGELFTDRGSGDRARSHDLASRAA